MEEKKYCALLNKRDRLENSLREIQSEINIEHVQRELRKREKIRKNFRLKKDHIKLLKQMEFEGMWHADFVSIGASGKRPFGNSNILKDVARILEWKTEDADELTLTQDSQARKLLDELHLAVNAIIKQKKI